jgi:hypothetical protein
MRNILALVLACVLSGCGGNDICDNADFVVDGVCVDTNGEAVTPEMITTALRATDLAYSQVIGREVNVSQTLKDNGFGIQVVSASTNIDCGDPSKTFKGCCHYEEGYLVAKFNPTRNVDFQYSLGHEVMHVVNHYVLDSTFETELEHSFPQMFVQWAVQNSEDYQNTTEYHIVSNLVDWINGR